VALSSGNRSVRRGREKIEATAQGQTSEPRLEAIIKGTESTKRAWLNGVGPIAISGVESLVKEFDKLRLENEALKAEIERLSKAA
jgi:hypothetical protein